MQVVLQGAVDRDGIGQVAFGGCFLADSAEEAEEGAAGVGFAGAAARILDKVADAGRDHRLEQFFLGREVAVEGAGPTPARAAISSRGTPYPDAAKASCAALEDFLPVAPRVGARGPGATVANRGAGSV